MSHSSVVPSIVLLEVLELCSHAYVHVLSLKVENIDYFVYRLHHVERLHRLTELTRPHLSKVQDIIHQEVQDSL